MRAFNSVRILVLAAGLAVTALTPASAQSMTTPTGLQIEDTQVGTARRTQARPGGRRALYGVALREWRPHQEVRFLA